MSDILANPQTAPHILAVQKNDADAVNEVQLTLHVHRELRWFEGHFPQVALLPGVVQITWVVEFARQYFSLPAQFRSMSNMKFMRFIMPDTQIVLWLRYVADKGELSFEYREGQKVCASGRVGFGP
jgi:3-hydroxymyristoyl/3-hydroxydecanoyl-(acyl carrier protein) dehydratase